MKTEKPSKLIDLIRQFMAETDKINIGKIYIAIVEETAKITFIETRTTTFSDLIYKHLIRLGIKDYIHSGHSKESIKVLTDVISVLSDADVVAA